MKAAELLVEVAQAGGDAGNMTIALEGDFGHRDSVGEGGVEALESALILTARRELVEAVLGELDLVERRGVEVDFVGTVDHVLAEADQLAAEEPVVDRAAIVLGVDDADGRRRQARQVGPAAGIVERAVVLEIVAQRDRVGDLAMVDQFAGGREDAAVTTVGKVLRPEKLGNRFVGAIVAHDRAEQGHLRLEVVRRRAIACFGVGLGFGGWRYLLGRFSRCHAA